MCTWVIEAPDTTWAKAEPVIGQWSEQETIAYLEDMWAHLLKGHKLVGNRSYWRRFPVIRNKNWHYKNIVLLGDALHTAHFSIGSGTKLAMEDAINLFNAFDGARSVQEALSRFQGTRREDVEKTQYAANVSALWTENPARYWGMEPIQACFSMLSRAKAVTYENLRMRDPQFVEQVQSWFAGKVRAEGFDVPADNPPPPMFTPFRIGQMVVQNRVVVSPMNMYSAEPGGIPGDFHLVHLGRFGMGGAGLVFAEMTAVSEQARITPGCPGIYTDAQVAAWKRISDFIHRESGAKFCLQLGHSGRKGSTRRGWEGMDHPLADGNWEIVAASPLAFHEFMHVPREITRAEMDRVRDDYAQAALNAERAGFDMIEVHCGHGYLLSGFISPLSNQRTDAYGGSLENRMRFPLEVFDTVRAHWPKHKPISVRISATDWAPGGITPEDALRVAAMFKATRRRHPRCLGRDDIAVGQSGLWPNVSDAVLGNDPQRSRRSDNCGRRHHHGGSNQYHRGRRPCRFVRAGAPAPDQPAFHAGCVGGVRLRRASLALALPVGQGSGIPALSATADRIAGAARRGKAVKPRSAPRHQTGGRVTATAQAPAGTKLHCRAPWIFNCSNAQRSMPTSRGLATGSSTSRPSEVAKRSVSRPAAASRSPSRSIFDLHALASKRLRKSASGLVTE